MFTRCGAYEEALSSFQKSGNWRQVFCMASLLRHTDEQVISLARSVAGMNSLCVPFHENAKPVIFLMITVRGVETQSISKTLSTLTKNVLSKSTFYGHCFFRNVNGAIELLCMGIGGRCFRRAFSIKSSAFQRNLRISKTVLLLNASCELELPQSRGRKQENNRELTQRRQRRQRKRQNQQNNNFARESRFLYISLPSLHDYDVNVQQTFRQISLFVSR